MTWQSLITVEVQFYAKIIDHRNYRDRQVKNNLIDLVFHNDHGRSHSSFNYGTMMAKNNIITLRQLPYSPDLGTSDSLLFPRIKRNSYGRVLIILLANCFCLLNLLSSNIYIYHLPSNCPTFTHNCCENKHLPLMVSFTNHNKQ